MELLSILGAVAILFAALGYGTERVLDILGWSRSSKLLRQENEDLVRRNEDLDSTVTILRSEVAKLNTDIDALRAQVAELQKRDQTAVLAALAEHERNAGQRHERMVAVLTEIRDRMAPA